MKYIILIARAEEIPPAKRTEPDQIKIRFYPIVRHLPGSVSQVFTVTSPDPITALKAAQKRFPSFRLSLAVEEKDQYDATISRLAYAATQRRDDPGLEAKSPGTQKPNSLRGGNPSGRNQAIPA